MGVQFDLGIRRSAGISSGDVLKFKVKICAFSVHFVGLTTALSGPVVLQHVQHIGL